MVKSLVYSANGQKVREEHGNGVVTTCEYEPQTQRLIGIKTERLAGHASGAKVLQELRYEYDPVGNVQSICNDAGETRFWRNQKVVRIINIPTTACISWSGPADVRWRIRVNRAANCHRSWLRIISVTPTIPALIAMIGLVT